MFLKSNFGVIEKKNMTTFGKHVIVGAYMSNNKSIGLSPAIHAALPKIYRRDIIEYPIIDRPLLFSRRGCSERFRPWRSMLEVRDRSPFHPSPIESVLDLATYTCSLITRTLL